MKIQPVSIWRNGVQYSADEFNVRIVADDLESAATFYYSVSAKVENPAPESVDGEPVAPTYHNALMSDGNVNISGEDYDVWGESANVNLAAYEYVAQKLGLTLVTE